MKMNDQTKNKLEKFYSPMALTIMAGEGGNVWLYNQLLKFMGIPGLVKIVTDYGHHLPMQSDYDYEITDDIYTSGTMPTELTPYIPPCPVCEVDRCRKMLIADQLCKHDNCVNITYYGDYCSSCIIVNRRLMHFNQFKFGVNGFGPAPAAGICSVYNCGKPLIGYSWNHYPVCVAHGDRLLSGNSQTDSIEMLFECSDEHRNFASATVYKTLPNIRLHSAIKEWMSK